MRNHRERGLAECEPSAFRNHTGVSQSQPILEQYDVKIRILKLLVDLHRLSHPGWINLLR